jgi:hypothetical protein
MSNTKEKNIKNLISLWEIVGNSFQTVSSKNSIHHCYVPNSEWPNRIWFDQEVIPQMIKTAKEITQNSPINLTLSHWSDFANEHQAAFEQIGFVKKSEQIGMSMPLQEKLVVTNRIRLEKITNEKQAASWTKLYPQSFGYEISAEILTKTYDTISYYSIHFEEQPIGTVFTHTTGNTIGIHGLGIIPMYRKQGLAEEAMLHLLNQAIDQGIAFATLQSSRMGKNVYLKIGFSEDFLITNYIMG